MSGTWAHISFRCGDAAGTIVEYDVEDSRSTLVMRHFPSGAVISRHNVASDGPKPTAGKPWKVLDLDTDRFVGVDRVDEVIAVRDRRK